MATAQMPDYLTYKGKRQPILTNPLEDYFNKYPEARPKSNTMCSALWRGFIGYWEIKKDNKLYLVGLGEGCDNKSYPVGAIFVGKNQVFADWYSGLILIPQGEMIRYVHMGYESQYESYLMLRIEKGIFIGEEKFNNKEYQEFRQKKYNEHKKRKKYRLMNIDLDEEDEGISKGKFHIFKRKPFMLN